METQINSDRKALLNGESKDSFLAYLDGAGLTEDEYWESMYDTYRRTMTVAKYTEALRKKFLENNVPDALAWEEYCFQTTKAILAKQDIYLRDDNAWSLNSENYNFSGVWPSI